MTYIDLQNRLLFIQESQDSNHPIPKRPMMPNRQIISPTPVITKPYSKIVGDPLYLDGVISQNIEGYSMRMLEILHVTKILMI